MNNLWKALNAMPACHFRRYFKTAAMASSNLLARRRRTSRSTENFQFDDRGDVQWSPTTPDRADSQEIEHLLQADHYTQQELIHEKKKLVNYTLL